MAPKKLALGTPKPFTNAGPARKIHTAVKEDGKVSKPATKKRAKGFRKPKGPSLWDTIINSSFSKKQPSSDTKSLGVLDRPTKRAIRDRVQVVTPMEQPKTLLLMMPSKGPKEVPEPDPPGRVIHEVLPTELLQQIFGYLVVEKACFIYPTSSTGKEQPDLAMTCMAIRLIVLPLYYSRNTFAIELPGPGQNPMMFARTRIITNNWLEATQKWIRYIRHWVFTIDDTMLVSTPGNPGEQEAKAILLSVKLSGPCRVTTSAADSNSEGEQSSSSVPSPIIEIHKDARCLLRASSDGNDRCIVPSNPSWVNDAVIETLGVGASYDGSVTAGTVQRLQERLSANVKGISMVCCTLKSCDATAMDII